jgi:acylphosphatase
MGTMHLVVRGRVQGVCYRMHAQEEARRWGLDGWVRNCADGTVEIVASGPPSTLQLFKKWCGQGPVSAQVSRVDASDWPDQPLSKGFHIRW